MSAPLSLTDLEQQLAGPDGPALRQDLLARLAQLETNLRQAIARGLSREKFLDAQAAADAARAAYEVLSARVVVDAPAARPPASLFSR
ncbi:EscE/YscE/SsaE family type III secretion system needle protein co-chaperone [Pigmentiphaga aceris]|nr:EscE/YscE/SsaE family type III secretion system needle protein co-chaperone [Pigmentiphaga aceris]